MGEHVKTADKVKGALSIVRWSRVLLRSYRYILEESTKLGTDPCLGSGSHFTRGATKSDVTGRKKLMKYNMGCYYLNFLKTL